MNSSIFQSEPKQADDEVPFFNVCAVRASAGMLLFFAFLCFENAWLPGNSQPTWTFMVIFLAGISIRRFIKPPYAPRLIIGQRVVRRNQVGCVGALQKRLAWAISLMLALTMLRPIQTTPKML